MEAWSEGWEALAQQIVLFVPKIVSAGVVFFVGLYLAGWAARAAAAGARHRTDDPEVILLVERVVRIGCISLVAIVSLGQVDFDLTGFVTGLGIMGVTIGFALQDVAKNFVAGLLLLLQQPFDVGDAIEVSGQAGVVTAIHFRATELRTFEGLEVVIPNADVYVKVVRRFGQVLHRRQSVTVTAATGDLDRVSAVIRGALADVPGLVQDRPSPKLGVTTWKPDSTTLTVWYWIELRKTTELEAVDATIRAIRDALKAADVEPVQLVAAATHPDAAGGVARERDQGMSSS